MESALPKLLGAGLFDSRIYFPAVAVTKQRPVTCYEIELFCEDGGHSVVNEIVYPIQKGNLLVAKPGDLRYSHLHFKAKYLHFSSHDPEICRLIESLPTFTGADLYEVLFPYFERTHQAMMTLREFEGIHGATAVLRLLCKLRDLREQAVRQEVVAPDSLLAPALCKIHEDFHEPLCCEELARLCGISLSHFHRSFTNTMGISPVSYLNRVRIAEAKRLLLTKDDSLCRIAELCGFSGQSYFTRCFSEAVGKAPGAWRKTARRLLV